MTEEKSQEEEQKRMIDWLSVIDKESERRGSDFNKVYWTDSMKTGYKLIATVRSGKVAMYGPKGSGKSTILSAFGTQYNIEHRESKVLVLPFGFLDKKIKDGSKEAMQSILAQSDVDILGTEVEPIYAAILSNYIITNDIDVPSDIYHTVRDEPERCVSKMESLLPSKTRKNLLAEAYNQYFSKLNILFLDLPDYQINSDSEINKDLNNLSKLYTEWNQFGKLVLVFSMQSELNVKHFFLGKAHKITVNTLTPQETFEMFKLNFPDISPFTEESVKRLSAIARGIPRIFKKYALKVLVEHLNTENEIITPEFVERSIPPGEIMSDMELELMSLFPKSEDSRELVIRILEFVRNKGGKVTQKELTDEFKDEYVSQYLGRVLRKIEGKFIIREKKQEGSVRYFIITLKDGNQKIGEPDNRRTADF